MATLAERVLRRLLVRENNEPSPYYQGRYLVAYNTVRNANRGLSLPYEVAEVLFQDSRYAKKIELWLQQRREGFEHWEVLSDGSIGLKLTDTPDLPPKKQPQSVKDLTTTRRKDRA